MRKIADAAFSGCKRLEKVILPSSLENIDRFAFYACESLTEILIPEKVREIGTDAFGKCDRLKTIRLHCDQIVFDEHGVGDPFGYKSNVTEVYASQALIRRIIDFDLRRYSSAESFCGFLMDSVWFRTLKEENQRRQIAQWKASGRCQYCGGKLKGLFTRRCLSCGREQ